MLKAPYPYEVNGKLVTCNGSLILNTTLFLIKPFLIAKFDCNLETVNIPVGVFNT